MFEDLCTSLADDWDVYRDHCEYGITRGSLIPSTYLPVWKTLFEGTKMYLSVIRYCRHSFYKIENSLHTRVSAWRVKEKRVSRRVTGCQFAVFAIRSGGLASWYHCHSSRLRNHLCFWQFAPLSPSLPPSLYLHCNSFPLLSLPLSIPPLPSSLFNLPVNIQILIITYLAFPRNAKHNIILT